jgi:hypothetical protein
LEYFVVIFKLEIKSSILYSQVRRAVHAFPIHNLGFKAPDRLVQDDHL